jgi:hypothetical protein
MCVTLDVQGQIFKTNYDTLIKIPYFKDMFESCGQPTETIFIDRPSHIFKHILSLAVDPYYQYPAKYVSELDFYCINSNEIKLYDKNQKICNDIYFLKNKCRHPRCNMLSIKETLFCSNHNPCLISNCMEYVYPDNNYCSKHYNNGRCCDARGCNNKRTNLGYCDEHQS